MTAPKNDADPPPHADGSGSSEWIRLLDGRVHRLAPLAIIIYVVYLYYGIIAPLQADGRTQRLQTAQADLETVTKQFAILRGRYSALVGQPEGLSDVRFVGDAVLDSVKDPSQGLTPEQELELVQLRAALKDISLLYEDHFETHVRPTSSVNDERTLETNLTQINAYRDALSTLLATRAATSSDIAPRPAPSLDSDSAALRQLEGLLLPGGDPHAGISDDPVNDLGHLTRLEAAIRELENFAASKYDRQFADTARPHLDSAALQLHSLGDTITKTLGFYSQLSEYVPLRAESIRLSPGSGLSVYEVIRNLLAAPVPIRSFADLGHLDTLLTRELEQSASHLNSPVIKLATLDFEIDRLTVLSFLPVALAVLVYLLTFYEAQRHHLLLGIGHRAPILLEQPRIRRFARPLVSWCFVLSVVITFLYSSASLLTRIEIDWVRIILVSGGFVSVLWLARTVYRYNRRDTGVTLPRPER